MTWLRARTPEQIEERRRAILEAAAGLFSELGYESVRLAAIATRAGISKSNLYRYFESKEQMFLELHQRDVESWVSALDTELRGDGRRDDPEAFVEHWVATLRAHPRYVALIPLLASALERNVGVDAVAAFKSGLMVSVRRAEAAVRFALPGLSGSDPFHLIRTGHALAAGLWPMAHPLPVMQQVLARPEFAHLAVDFWRELSTALRALVHGFLRTAHPATDVATTAGNTNAAPEARSPTRASRPASGA